MNMSNTEARLNEAGIILPTLTSPAVAAYVPYKISGNAIYISGQLPLVDGKITCSGHLGDNVTIEEGKKAAHICALNILALLKDACGGNLDNVRNTIKLEILVAANKDFTEAHIVANGASELILTVLGDEVGKHARVAYGVSTLPLGAAVEVAAIFEV